MFFASMIRLILIESPKKRKSELIGHVLKCSHPRRQSGALELQHWYVLSKSQSVKFIKS